MLLLKLVLGSLAAATLVIGVCESDDKSDETKEQRVLEIAAIYAGDNISNIPVTGDYYDCILKVGTQPEPPASPLRDVGGRCLWTVVPQGSQWVATFRETWFCSDWNAELAGFPPCDGLTGFHEWKYYVSLADNSTNLLDDSGQFAPDMRVQ